MKKIFVSCVIAAYNEKGNIEKLFLEISEIMKAQKINYEIIGIIDGNDGTYESLLNLKKQKKNNKIKLYHHDTPLGLGRAFGKGFNLVNKNSTHVLTMDADLSHDPKEIPILLNEMEKTNADIIIGSRYCSGGGMSGVPKWKKFLSKIMNIFFNFITSISASDKTSGYRIYTKEANDLIKNKYTLKNFAFLPEILVLAQKRNLKIIEYPIHFKYRTLGVSKMNIIKTSRGYLKLLYNIFIKKYN